MPSKAEEMLFDALFDYIRKYGLTDKARAALKEIDSERKGGKFTERRYLEN